MPDDGLKLGVDGLNAAVDAAVDTNVPPNSCMQAEQLPLLPLRNTEAQGDSHADKGDTHRGVGRPKGAKNKNTEVWREYLLSKYSSPLEVMASTMTRGVMDLARDLGYLTTGENGGVVRKPTPDELRECLKIQLSCAKELAPYIHQKQPQAIDVGDGGMMTLNIFSAPAQDVQEADDFGFEVMDLNIEENQGVSECETQETNDGATNGKG